MKCLRYGVTTESRVMLSLIPQLLPAQVAKQSWNELPNTTSRPGHLHIPSSTENPHPSSCPSLKPLKVHFSHCSWQLQPFSSPRINHCYNFPFPPSGKAVACPTFHRAAQPWLSMEICIRKSFSSEGTLHHSHCHSRMPLHHQSYFEKHHFPFAMK